MATQTKNRRKNGKSKTTPDLMGALSKAQSQSQAQGKTRTAAQIADDFETEAKKLQNIADILRGKK